jgi:hypothetical protein
MAASHFMPAPRRVPGGIPDPRAIVATVAARTAARGAGLADVVALPSRGLADPFLTPTPPAVPSASPSLRLVPPAGVNPRRRTAALATMVLAVLLMVGGTVAAAAGSGAGELAVAGHVVLQPG